jgi:hypothetical protein
VYIVTVFSRNGFLLDTYEREQWNEVTDLLDNLAAGRPLSEGGHFEIMFHKTGCMLTPGHSGMCIV